MPVISTIWKLPIDQSLSIPSVTLTNLHVSGSSLSPKIQIELHIFIPDPLKPIASRWSGLAQIFGQIFPKVLLSLLQETSVTVQKGRLLFIPTARHCSSHNNNWTISIWKRRTRDWSGEYQWPILRRDINTEYVKTLQELLSSVNCLATELMIALEMVSIAKNCCIHLLQCQSFSPYSTPIYRSYIFFHYLKNECKIPSSLAYILVIYCLISATYISCCSVLSFRASTRCFQSPWNVRNSYKCVQGKGASGSQKERNDIRGSFSRINWTDRIDFIWWYFRCWMSFLPYWWLSLCKFGLPCITTFLKIVAITLRISSAFVHSKQHIFIGRAPAWNQTCFVSAVHSCGDKKNIKFWFKIKKRRKLT